MKSITRSFGLAIALGTAVLTGSAPSAWAAGSHAAKVPIETARATALKVAPGTLVAEELEHEGGLWIYSFEIRPPGEKGKRIQEVNINADTGAVVGVGTEND